MSNQKANIVPLLLIFIISVFSLFDLFIHSGRSANMDGLVHITTAAMFADAFRSGDFPVIWLDGFANYGMPIGMFAQQITSYLGMGFTLLVNDPVLAYNIVAFIGILLSNVFFYYFLRLYFNPLYAFLGTFLFNFAPFRILDLYIRGAIPETFSTIFLPLILISIYSLIQKKNSKAFFYLVFSLAGLILCHPMMFITYSFIFVPYFFFNLLTSSKVRLTKQNLQYVVMFFLSIVIAIGIAGYYLIPLSMEVKYVYYGSEKNHLLTNQYLGWVNYLDPSWYYFYKNDIFPRGHFLQSGLLETIAIGIGIVMLLFRWFRGSLKKQITIFDFAVVTTVVIIFFTTEFSGIIYQTISVLGNIQFPWRMLSAFIFLPPIIIAYMLSKLNKSFLVILLVLIVCIIRFPELYGKNYTAYPLSTYTFTPLNLHSNNLNTIWTGETDSYPVKKEKIEIIDGEGRIVDKKVKNSSRSYTIDASTQLRLVDYTFYFPGWMVYVDGKETAVEFQDPNYRGVITYNVPPGKHDVVLKFEDTKIRFLGKIVSVAFIILIGVIFLFRKKLKKAFAPTLH